MPALPRARTAATEPFRRALATSLTDLSAPPAAAPGPVGSPSPASRMAGSQALALPGLAAWSLLFRRKALHGILRSWSLNSRGRLR